MNEAVFEDVHHFDAWLVATEARLEALTDDIFSSFTPPPIKPGRKPRSDATKRRRAVTGALIANLALVTLLPVRRDGVAVPLMNAKRTRYDHRDMSADVLRWAVAELEAQDLLTRRDAVFKKHRTVLVPTAKFVALLTQHNVEREKVGRARGGETILLRAASGRAKELVDYQDTSETETLRAQMATINEALNNGNICLGGRTLNPIRLVRMFDLDVATATQDFKRHGRLYGGLWEGLLKADRHLLTIGGAPVVDLDFSAMFLRLAYARQGATPPDGDLYSISGLEGHRNALKQVVSSLFFRQTKSMRLPPGIKDQLPPGWPMVRVREAVKAAHPAIAPLLDTYVGFELMGLESRILVAVLLELIAGGIVALPMHDGIMVAERSKQRAIDAMRKACLSVIGVALPVTEKPIQRPGEARTAACFEQHRK